MCCVFNIRDSRVILGPYLPTRWRVQTRSLKWNPEYEFGKIWSTVWTALRQRPFFWLLFILIAPSSNHLYPTSVLPLLSINVNGGASQSEWTRRGGQAVSRILPGFASGNPRCLGDWGKERAASQHRSMQMLWAGTQVLSPAGGVCNAETCPAFFFVHGTMCLGPLQGRRAGVHSGSGLWLTGIHRAGSSAVHRINCWLVCFEHDRVTANLMQNRLPFSLSLSTQACMSSNCMSIRSRAFATLPGSQQGP